MTIRRNSFFGPETLHADPNANGKDNHHNDNARRHSFAAFEGGPSRQQAKTASGKQHAVSINIVRDSNNSDDKQSIKNDKSRSMLINYINPYRPKSSSTSSKHLNNNDEQQQQRQHHRHPPPSPPEVDRAENARKLHEMFDRNNHQQQQPRQCQSFHMRSRKSGKSNSSDTSTCYFTTQSEAPPATTSSGSGSKTRSSSSNDDFRSRSQSRHRKHTKKKNRGGQQQGRRSKSQNRRSKSRDPEEGCGHQSKSRNTTQEQHRFHKSESSLYDTNNHLGWDSSHLAPVNEDESLAINDHDREWTYNDQLRVEKDDDNNNGRCQSNKGPRKQKKHRGKSADGSNSERSKSRSSSRSRRRGSKNHRDPQPQPQQQEHQFLKSDSSLYDKKLQRQNNHNLAPPEEEEDDLADAYSCGQSVMMQETTTTQNNRNMDNNNHGSSHHNGRKKKDPRGKSVDSLLAPRNKTKGSNNKGRSKSRSKSRSRGNNEIGNPKKNPHGNSSNDNFSGNGRLRNPPCPPPRRKSSDGIYHHYFNNDDDDASSFHESDSVLFRQQQRERPPPRPQPQLLAPRNKKKGNTSNGKNGRSKSRSKSRSRGKNEEIGGPKNPHGNRNPPRPPPPRRKSADGIYHYFNNDEDASSFHESDSVLFRQQRERPPPRPQPQRQEDIDRRVLQSNNNTNKNSRFTKSDPSLFDMSSYHNNDEWTAKEDAPSLFDENDLADAIHHYFNNDDDDASSFHESDSVLFRQQQRERPPPRPQPQRQEDIDRRVLQSNNNTNKNSRFTKSDPSLFDMSSYHNNDEWTAKEDAPSLFDENDLADAYSLGESVQTNGNANHGASTSKENKVGAYPLDSEEVDMGYCEPCTSPSISSPPPSPPPDDSMEKGKSIDFKLRRNRNNGNNELNKSDAAIIMSFCQPCSPPVKERQEYDDDKMTDNEMTEQRGVHQRRMTMDRFLNDNFLSSSLTTTAGTSQPKSSPFQELKGEEPQSENVSSCSFSLFQELREPLRRHSVPTKRPDPPSLTRPVNDTPNEIRRCQTLMEDDTITITDQSKNSSRAHSCERTGYGVHQGGYARSKSVESELRNNGRRGKSLESLDRSSGHLSDQGRNYGDFAQYSQDNNIIGNNSSGLHGGTDASDSSINKNLPQSTNSIASTNAISMDIHYNIGSALMHKSHALAFTSPSQAFILLTKLPLNVPLFVKRTTKKWSFGKLVGRATDENGEMSLVVVLDGKGKVRKVLERSKWQKCLRLVNWGVIDAFLSDDNECLSMGGTTMTSSATVHSGTTGSVSSYQRKHSAPGALGRGTSNNASGNNRRSVSFHHPGTGGGANDGIASLDAASHAKVNTSMANVNGHLFPRRNSAPELHTILHQNVSNDTDGMDSQLASVMTPPLRSTTNSPTNRTNTPPHTSLNKTSNPNSPNTVMVNLNARHFCGSRRQRMRPIPRKKSAPNLSSLSSLSASCSGSSSTDASSIDSTRAPSGGGDGGGTQSGLKSRMWKSCDSLENNDPILPYYDTIEKANTDWDAELGGGMAMKLRGVEP
eukprot:CAMPEP_0183746522 /NCGR_PEP_ID=MMETSP0737-20130205/66797_1 /TAXON_ID=385413 /ORGANISM="Thalassiosira miniscula, Strain CCMP1093" /LENGTH=1528 /DNA_ID=CAMNT_0025982219 /DNA_START=266 /DNA_END=4853 /DNA_ORIENTATION=-